jgi:hypothetical protein
MFILFEKITGFYCFSQGYIVPLKLREKGWRGELSRLV